MRTMEEVKKILTEFYENYDTGDLKNIFSRYMREIGARKIDHRRKDNSNTYLIDGESTDWNRVECYYHKNNPKTYGDHDLEIVLRKRMGDYLIVAKGLERAFEISYGKVINYDENLLTEIVKEHPMIFAMMKGA